MYRLLQRLLPIVVLCGCQGEGDSSVKLEASAATVEEELAKTNRSVKTNSLRMATPNPTSSNKTKSKKTTQADPSSAAPASGSLEFLRPLTWTQNPNRAVPNAGWLNFSLPHQSAEKPVPGKVHIEISYSQGKSTLRKRLSDFKSPSLVAGEQAYSIPLLDLKPEIQYTVTISLVRDGGQAELQSEPLQIETEPLPDLFPEFDVRLSMPQRMEAGLTLFNLIRWKKNKPDTEFGAIVALDANGRVRWFYQAQHMIFIVRQLSNGNLLYGYGNRTEGLIEIDLFGNVVRQWNSANLGREVPSHATPVAVDSLHHDAVMLDDETFLALSTTLNQVKPYFDPTYHSRRRIPEANLVTDVVVEFRTDGTVLRSYSLFELLDPRRIGYGSLHNFWDSRGYENVPGGTFDWSHSNSVTHDPRDDSILVSVRHQDAVIKIDRKSGELVWILGNPRKWKGKHSRKLLKPIGRPSWQYHQHAVEITPQGTLLLFDNGNYQAVPFDKILHAKENRSRVVEFKVDEQDMTVEQVWEYDGYERGGFYSTFLCDVDWLPQTGNVLVTNGGEIRDENGERTDYAPGEQQWAEIFEVTYEQTPQRVFDLLIKSSAEQTGFGWSVYRSERISNFFDHVKTAPSISTKP
ncbi:aryl-sulfate sulfotransferase [Thalassoglobus polymorphus]|uniref:Arylsulfate sulfotransferase AssT n=1 Tax=Thalassoglobus polymorphus TaxID=2527994 RepID=A0A517QKM4_9PLAN|nr:aryl-sulfate sulfotransferase [Thalassoglobus polymorphus]QDT32180.1 Arylsulfate sulfotransferase AssT precursor [Thalassoglobus polymorphus]